MREGRGIGLEFAVDRIEAHIASTEEGGAVGASACTILVNDGGREASTVITIQRYLPPD
jgi:hypothetical protein